MKIKVLFFLLLLLTLTFKVPSNIFARDGGPPANDPDINIRIRNNITTDNEGELFRIITIDSLVGDKWIERSFSYTEKDSFEDILKMIEKAINAFLENNHESINYRE